MKKHNYIGRVLAYCMIIVHTKLLYLLKSLVIVLTLFTFSSIQSIAGNVPDGGNDANPVAYDEIPVRVLVDGYKMFYLDAIYTNNKLLYVNIEDLFRTLDIACTVDQAATRISGFIENENKKYVADYTTGQLQVGDKTFNNTKGLLKESGTFYIESSLITKAFGIALNFNYRAMTITLSSAFELPLMKQLRIEKMRSNLAKIQEVEIADTVLQRNYHMFKFGTMNWYLGSSKRWNGSTDNYAGLGVGAEVLNGEADIFLNYYTQYKFDRRQLQYIWKWVHNENKIIKQAQVGKITNQTISFINNQVIGAVIRNSPTTVRKASGYYTITEITEPNWTIELYINNVLVDYTRAEASGAYTFKVPIVYGYTTLKLKYYGPQGEERTEERSMNVPYTVMPVNEFEYGLTAGVVQDSSHSRFGRADFNYGVSRLLTVGGGLEYLSSITTGAYIPFAKATFQPFSSLTLNAEYAYGVRTRALLNYSFGKNAVLEIDYAKYVDGQKATIFNANEERKIRLSVPFKHKNINGFFKLDYTQLIYSEFYYNQGNAMVSMYYNQFSANSSLQMNWIGQKMPYIINETSFSYRMRNGFTVRPSARYNISENSMMSCKAEIEKRISKAYLLLSYEQYFTFKDHYVNLTFRYDLPFARASASVAQSKHKVMTSESAQGSLAFGADKFTHTSNNSSVGKGGILLYPFLDLNRNGVFDKGEHMVKLNTVKLSGGRAIYNEKDSIIRIPDLNAFINYTIEFQDRDLESISWRFKHKIYSILVDPNQFKRVDVPVISVGEVSGMTYIDKNNLMKGLGRIILKFYDKNSHKEVAQTLSESDGYIYYLGLEPGAYMACVDSAQLRNLGLKVDPPCREFTIKSNEDGDIVSGLDFILKPTIDEQIQFQQSKEQTVIGSGGSADSMALLNATKKNLNEKEELVLPEIEVAENLTDSVTLPTKTNPAEPLLVEKSITSDTGNTISSTDTLNLPVKTNPAELLVVEKAITKEPDIVARTADTLSLPVKTKPENIVAKNEKIIPDSLKINELVKLHRIDQQAPVSNIHKDFKLGDTLFKVQLLALPKPLKDKNYFKKLIADVPGLTIEETLGEDGLYHYSTGTFKGIAEAAKYQRLIRKSGWKDSFVAKYAGERRTEATFRSKLEKSVKQPGNTIPKAENPGAKIEIADSEKTVLEKKEQTNITNSKSPAKPYSALQQGEIIDVESEGSDYMPGDTLYEVQLLALSKPIQIDNYFALLLSKMPGLKIRENRGEDGIYRYTTETFKSIEKARGFNAAIREKGWVDSFITTYSIKEKMK